MALFSDTRMIWVAAWIDSHDALAEAYSAALAVKDAQRRRQLIDLVADPPIEMSDVKNLAEERKRISPDLLDEWNARKRIDFGNRFRALVSCKKRGGRVSFIRALTFLCCH